MPIAMLERERRQLQAALWVGVLATAALWFFHAARILLGVPVGTWGVVPRRFYGLHGVLTSPLVHKDFTHLFHNSVPIFAATTLLVYFYPRLAARLGVLMYALTGIAVWLLARGEGWGSLVDVPHIGASGVAYALVSFLFWSGVFKRSLRSVAVTLVIVLYFSGMVAGIFPGAPEISWESHLLGALVGAGLAYGFRDSAADHRPAPPAKPYRATRYFRPDVFDMTLAERAELARQRAEDLRRAQLQAEAFRQQPPHPTPRPGEQA